MLVMILELSLANGDKSFYVILQTFYAHLVMRLEDGWRALYQCMETGMADVGNNDQNITS